jgi:hypothetical protein
MTKGPDGWPEDGISAGLRRRGIPLTRENHIRANYGRIPSEDEWTPEDEATLPKHLREGIDRD